ncbi:MAG TPA: sigma-54 dependent transcriptional regulator [Gemmatimonadaceae bacterium]|nr:sigma-54 dependent transcriptional regulator [Gemmatimonadaceae bacterium]
MRIEVLVVDQEPDIREALASRIVDWGHTVRAVGDASDALREIDTRRPHLVLCAVTLPKSSGIAVLHRIKERDRAVHVVMTAPNASVDTAVEAMKAGACDFLTTPFDWDAVHAAVASVERGIREQQVTQSMNARLDRMAAGTSTPARTASMLGIVGDSHAIQELLETVRIVASSDASAIITGESGTGKEVVARAIHALSRRHEKPFVAINAAAIPDGLVESEIFGHEQGAFTGATRARAGSFELAHGGTLFLDEIAEMPMSLQPKLLRILETGRARRLGAAREQVFDVRVLAATNRPAGRAIRESRLREDLFYRLSVFELVIPPLRQRTEDVPLLAQHFVREMNRKHALQVEGVREVACQLLASHTWPGNVRELRNVIERAAIVARSGWIDVRHLPPYLRVYKAGSPPNLTLPASSTLAEVEREVVIQMLARVDGNKAAAARQLGVDVKTIRSKLRGIGG